jgi:hypothetical protein
MIDASQWAGRSHRGRPTVPLELSAKQRAELEAVVRRPTSETRTSRRAQAVLLMADGVPAVDIARTMGLHQRTVFRWRQRFRVPDPVARLADAPRSGRPRSLSARRKRLSS